MESDNTPRQEKNEHPIKSKPLDEEAMSDAVRTFLRVKKRVEMKQFHDSNTNILLNSFYEDTRNIIKSNKHKINAILSVLLDATEQDRPSGILRNLFSTAQMAQIEYINVQDDPLFSTGYTYTFNCNSGKGYLEIIDFDGHILQTGFKIIYPPSFLSVTPNWDIRIIRGYLKHYYLNERIQIIDGIKLRNYANDTSQSFISRFKVNNKNVNNCNIMNKKNWSSAYISESLPNDI